jgi:oxygen-independent coproporphyrinogen-3 oxidase
LYVHIPFCARKCLYCSFAVVVAAEKHAEKYLQCLALEARRFRGISPETVYVGGGTPSRLTADQIAALMKTLTEAFDCSRSDETTIEANPEDIDDDRLRSMKEAGVDRISLGVQTFHDRYLDYLGRSHDASTAVKAAKLAGKAGFDSVNMDLMFGFEGQTEKELKSDIDRMTDLGPDHISLYGLTVEANSRFFAQGKVISNDQQAGMYLMILDAMKKNGYRQYEVSNFSKPGHESVHNRNYWLGKEYIGLGVGAHSYRNGRRWWNSARLGDYMARMEAGQSVEEGGEQISDMLRAKERLLFGLRMNAGVAFSALGADLKDILTDVQKRQLDTYIREGLLIVEGSSIKATDKGRLVLDEISANLI